MRFSYNSIIICNGLVPCRRYLHRGFQDFGNTSGCHFLVWFAVGALPGSGAVFYHG